MKNSSPRTGVSRQQYMHAGTIVGVSEASYRIAFGHRQEPASTTALSALATPVDLCVGDRVLVTGEQGEGLDGDCGDCGYIIGVLQQQAATKTLRADSQSVVRVEDERGRLLFEHDARLGRTTVAVPEGDLLLRSSNGSIELAAGETCLELSPKGLSLKAAEAEIDIDETILRGRVIHAVMHRAKWVYEKVETVAKRLIERTQNSYRRSDELHQTSAGRMRTLVDGSYRLRTGEQTDIRSDGDVRIDGKHIHLG